tara:strand:+ start:778 stop:942 length:165 start_codon:yes stop_codon:yes gene_type:complete
MGIIYYCLSEDGNFSETKTYPDDKKLKVFLTNEARLLWFKHNKASQKTKAVKND